MVFFRFSVVVASWLVRWYGCSCSGLGMIVIYSNLGMGMCLFRFGCADVVLIFFRWVCGEWWSGGCVGCVGSVREMTMLKEMNILFE